MRRPSTRGIGVAIAVGIAAGGAMVWHLASRRSRPAELSVAQAHAQAHELVLALFPKDSTPATRARAIAERRGAP